MEKWKSERVPPRHSTFTLFTLLVHRCVPIAYTGVNCRDRHLCIQPTEKRTRHFCRVLQPRKIGMPRSHIRWPTGHSKGAATGGAHGSRWGRNPLQQFFGNCDSLSRLRLASAAREPRRPVSLRQPRPTSTARERKPCAFGLVLGDEAVKRRVNDRPLAKATGRGKTATPRSPTRW